MRPEVLLFDVNETLSDTGVLATRFAELGADPLLAQLWYASVLRDGLAATMAGGDPGFAELAAQLLPPLLADQPLRGTVAEAVDVLTGVLGALPARPDVASGMRALAEAGFRLAALTVGSAATAQAVLRDAGVLDLVDPVLSTESTTGWKPAAAAYRFALDALGAAAQATMLVAVHPWDLNGAAHAGLRTAWLDRDGRAYPSVMRRPDVVAHDLDDLARRLARP